MTNETTYLENLLNNRKVVRSYQKAKVDKNSLEKSDPGQNQRASYP